MPISYPYISTPLETRRLSLVLKEIYYVLIPLLQKSIYQSSKIYICSFWARWQYAKKYQYYIRIFFNICAASDKVEEHFAQQNCFEHKNLVYEILLMKYEDFMTFLHLWDTVMQIFPWSIIECIIEEVKSNVKQLGLSISINYTDVGFVARFIHV